MHRQKQSGFTLVEMIVSLALFSVVVTIAVGSLLVLIGVNRQLQSEQTILTNLSFALDSMTREIRTGSVYFCSSRQNPGGGSPDDRIFADGETLDQEVQDCVSANTGNNPRNYHGLSFDEGGDSVTQGSGRIAYFHKRPDGSDPGALYRRISGENAELLTSSQINIVNAQFFVTATDDKTNDNDDYQPAVTIYLEAQDVNDPAGRIHRLQTTITQRELDI